MSGEKEKNPHMSITRVGVNGTDNWKCDYCNAQDTYEAIHETECAYEYPPCPHCGQTPECAPDCKGMMALMQTLIDSPDVYVAGIEPDETDSIH